MIPTGGSLPDSAVETAGLMETVEKQTAFSHRFHEPLGNSSPNSGAEFPTVPTAPAAGIYKKPKKN